MHATIAELEELVIQERRTAEHFEERANKDVANRDKHKECARLAYANAEHAELTIRAMRESLQY